MNSAAQCVRQDRASSAFPRSGRLVHGGAALTTVALGGILTLSFAPAVRACSFGPTYNSCMQQQEEQEQQRAEQERQRNEQEQQQAAQERQRLEQQEQMRAEQQRQLEEQQERQRRAQAGEQQSAAQRASAPRPEIGVPRQPRSETIEPRPRIGVPRESVANHSANGSSSWHSSIAEPSRLSRVGSQAVLQHVNSARSGLSGINKHPIPPGLVTRHPNGMLSVSASGGRHFTLRPNGTLSSLSVRDEVASFRADGRLERLQTGRMDVVYSPHGARTVIVHGPNHALIVSTGPHRGYVQRSVNLNGRRFVERTVVVGRVRTVRLYGAYRFHGVVLTYYVPHYYYAPAFYGWAYYRWAAPVAYTWPWTVAPWYVAYGPYFVVSPVYVGAYDWLTDYYLSQTLADEYAAQAAAAQATAADSVAQRTSLDSTGAYADGAPDGSSQGAAYAAADTPITPAIKEAIAQEVREQLSADNGAAAAQGGSPGAQGEAGPLPGNLSQVLQPHHVFVVDSDLSAATADDDACNLSAGNVLEFTAAAANDVAAADLTVISSRRTDCPAGTRVTLSLDSLAEMQNAFSARLDDGLAALRQQQGQNGIPAAPPSAIAPPPRPTDYPPVDEQDAAAMLDSAQQQANQAAASVAAQAFDTNAAS